MEAPHGIHVGTALIAVTLLTLPVSAQQPDLEGATREFSAALDMDPKSADALYDLAKTTMAQRRYNAAVRLLRRALIIRPDDRKSSLLLGLAHSKNGESGKAIEVLAPLVKAMPKRVRARLDLAAAYAEAERYAEAAEQYTQVTRLDPENDSARLLAATALLNDNRHQEALDVSAGSRGSFRSTVDEFDLHLVRGIALRRLGKFEQAEQDLRRAVELRHRDAEVQYHLGFVLARQGKLESARRRLELAAQLDPTLRDARFELLSVLRQLGDSEALRVQSTAFEKWKRRERARLMAERNCSRGSLYLEQGDPESALNEYRQAVRQDPEDAKGHYGVSRALARLGAAPNERIRALEKAVELDSGLAEAHNDLGILYNETGRLADAERLLQSALAINPQYLEALNNLGVVYARQGRNLEAEPLFRRAVEDDPGYAPAYANYGLTLAALERFAAAERILRKAEQLQPDNTKGLRGLAMVFMLRNQPEEALARFRKVAELNPTNSQAHRNVGTALTAVFHLEDALTSFSQAVALAPNSSRARYQRGRCLFDLQRNEEAKAELHKAAQLAPDSSDPLYLLALTERRLGKGRKAVNLLRTLVNKAPAHAAAHFQLGQLAAETQGDDAAVTHWRNAAQADPTHAEALFSLSRALRSRDADLAARYESRFETLRKKHRIRTRSDRLNHFALASVAAYDWDRAAAHLENAVTECGECGKQNQLRKNLGLLYARSGRPADGERELRLAARLAPGDVEIEQALRRIAQIQKNGLSTTP